MKKALHEQRQRRLAKFKKANVEFVKEIIQVTKTGGSDKTIQDLIRENVLIFSAIFGGSTYLHLPSSFVDRNQYIGEAVTSHGSVEVGKDEIINMGVSDKDIVTKRLEEEHAKYFGEAVG